MEDFWDGSDYFTGPALTEDMIRSAEDALGYKLPASYLRLLRSRNGGKPRRCCFPTRVPTSWANDHICVDGILGIGGTWGIDSPTGTRVMIEVGGYPDVGVIVGMTPSCGHDAVMLDYSVCGPRGEPHVIHVETECVSPTSVAIAPDFEAFLRGLVDCGQFEVL